MARKSADPAGDVEAVKRTLQAFWAPGPEGSDPNAVAEALRSLNTTQLHLVGAWIPVGATGPTGQRVVQVERIYAGVLNERA